MAANLAANPAFEIAGSGGALDSANWFEFGNNPASGTVSQRGTSIA